MYTEPIFIQQASIFECKQEKIKIHGNNYSKTSKSILPLKEHLDILVKLLYSLQAKKLRVLNIKSEVIPAISYK